MPTSFSQYISEAGPPRRVETLEELRPRIQSALNDPSQIPKREYEDLKYVVEKAIAAEFNPLAVKHWHGKGDETKHWEPALYDLCHAMPGDYTTLSALKAFQKKLDKVKTSTNHPFFQDLKAKHDQTKWVVEAMETLKSRIVTVSQQRTVVKAEKEVVLKKKFSDSSSLIAVLNKHKAEYIEKAKEMAGQQYDQAMKQLAKHDWDIDKLAPAPNSKLGRDAYKAAEANRSFYMNLTDSGATTPSFRVSSIRKASPAKRASMIANAAEGAEASYLAWVTKMVDKIGKSVESAEMTGSPWTGSKLSVKSHDGESQTWHTQMIINQSKYGTLFNQFPSRRLK